MRHEILAADVVGMARIVWDDAAGTVAGDHSHLPQIRDAIGNGPLSLGCPHGSVELLDPAHSPEDFLAALRANLSWTDGLELPGSLAGVTPTPYPPVPADAGNGVIY